MLFSWGGGGQACSASSYIQHGLFQIHLNLSIKMVQAPSMEGLSKAHPLFKQPLQYTQYSIAVAQTHATKFTSNLEKLWLGLPLCELQVNLLNHVLGMLSWFHLVFLSYFWVYFPVWQNTSASPSLQLFRRVAAALPGMDNTQDKSREDSILCVHVRRVRRSPCSLIDSPCQKESLLQHSES